MPGIDEADRLAILEDVRDDQDLRMAAQQEARLHMHLERAETAAEGDMLLRRQAILVAEHQHRMLVEGAADRGEIRVVERAGQVEADDFGRDNG